MRVAKIQTTLRKFFHHWITVTGPLHNLGKTERAVLAELIYYHYMFSQEVTNVAHINRLLFSQEVKGKICKSLDISAARYALVLTVLNRENVIKDKTLNQAYIPRLKPSDKTFIMAYKFTLIDNLEQREIKRKASKEIPTNSK